MKTIQDLKVGDVVWYTDINMRDRTTRKLIVQDDVVFKIGTKLIYIGNVWNPLVFRKDTMSANDEYAHKKLILDLAEYELNQEKLKIIKLIENSSSKYDASYDDVLAAAKLLGVEEEK